MVQSPRSNHFPPITQGRATRAARKEAVVHFKTVSSDGQEGGLVGWPFAICAPLERSAITKRSSGGDDQSTAHGTVVMGSLTFSSSGASAHLYRRRWTTGGGHVGSSQYWPPTSVVYTPSLRKPPSEKCLHSNACDSGFSRTSNPPPPRAPLLLLRSSVSVLLPAVGQIPFD